LDSYDLIVSCGWSEELGEGIISKIEAIGVHCAELDRYSYGTPIQLQIIDGITRSKHRIFSFTYEKNSSRAHTHNRLYSHEVDLDLSGNMDDILEQMTVTSKVLFNRYLDDYPNIEWKQWESEDIVRKKRVPKDSIISKDDIAKMDTEQLYNFFRCLEDPYPNGCIEDEKGYLYIKKVEFKKK
jgi:methionyl-tRNA formyltransferase